MLARFVDADHPDEVKRAVTPLTVARLATTTLYRMTPPLAAVVGRGLGVPLSTMGTAISVGEMTGLAGPIIGRRVDRTSQRRAMLVALVVLAVAAGVAASAPHVAVFAAGLVAIAAGKTLYDVAMGSWLGDRVDYPRRSRVVGLTEISWAGALLVGVPIAALVVALFGWRAAYVAAAGANLAVLVRLRSSLREHEPRARVPRDGVAAKVPWRRVGPAIGGFAVLMTASHFVFVVFGAWLEDAFDFSTVAIGGVALAMGGAELAASTSTARFTDRLGKTRAISLGAGCMIPAAALLAGAGGSAIAGVAALVVFIGAFEFALVSGLPLITELHPDARAGMFGAAAGAGTVGRGVAALVSTRLYEAHGMGASAAGAAACAFVVVVLFLAVVREPGR